MIRFICEPVVDRVGVIKNVFKATFATYAAVHHNSDVDDYIVDVNDVDIEEDDDDDNVQ